MDRAAEVLALVGLPRPAERLGDYPHQLSGGLRQRVMIAMALACEPKLLIADEPTTALDVTIQAQILALLDDLKDRLGMAMLLITHDMGVIAGRADRVKVMYAGRMVEATDTGTLFRHMRHPYTQALLASIPRLDQDSKQRLLTIGGLPPDLSDPPPGCRFAPRCSRATDRCRTDEPPLTGETLAHLFACWHPVDGPSGAGAADGTAPRAQAVADRPYAPPTAPTARTAPWREHRCSRCASWSRSSRSPPERSCSARWPPCTRSPTCRSPSTPGRRSAWWASRAAARPRSAGSSWRWSSRARARCCWPGRTSPRSAAAAARQRRDLQLMFQDPYSSLDPRMRVGSIIREPLVIQHIGSHNEQQQRVSELLDEVGLPRNAVERYPHEFSGGQRQRIGLARALTLSPRVIVADEPVSALDVSIRSQVLNLMKRLQADHGLTYIVISHDLAVVKYMADRIGVMYLGKMVEMGAADDIYERAAHPYTAGLIGTIPVPDPEGARAGRGAVIRGELPSPVTPPSGCRFRTRCPYAQDLCASEEPPLRPFGPGHIAACHFPLQTAKSEPIAARS